MSYILEALKKSEQLRGQGATATRLSLQPAMIEEFQPRGFLRWNSASPTLWPYFLGTVVLANGLGLFLWLRSPTPTPADKASTATPAAQIAAGTLRGSTAATSVAQANSAPDNTATASTQPMELSARDTAATKPVAGTMVPTTAVAPIAAPAVTAVPLAAETADKHTAATGPMQAPTRTYGATARTGFASIPGGSAATTASLGRTAAGSTPEKRTVEAANVAPATRVVAATVAPLPVVSAPALAQVLPAANAPVGASAVIATAVVSTPATSALPQSLQRELPPLEVAGFINAGGSTAMVMVNDKLLHEGEEVSPGLRVEKIETDSVIFGYKGYRFKR